MTIGGVIDQKLEKGITHKCKHNSSVLSAIQFIINDTYSIASIDVDIKTGIMTLTPVGEWIRKDEF